MIVAVLSAMPTQLVCAAVLLLTISVQHSTGVKMEVGGEEPDEAVYVEVHPDGLRAHGEVLEPHILREILRKLAEQPEGKRPALILKVHPQAEERALIKLLQMVKAAGVTPRAVAMAPERLSLDVTADGDVLLDGRTYEPAELAQRLAAHAKRHGDAARVHIHPSPTAPQARIVEVLAACRAAGIAKSTLVTRRGD